MAACDLARAALVFGLVWAPNLPAILALAFVRNSFSTFFSPAQRAAIRAVVPPDDLIAANSLAQLTDNAARLVGPGLGGLVLTVAGLRASFVIDAATFVASALFLIRLPALAASAADHPAPAARGRFWSEFRDGLRHIRRRHALLLAVASMVGASFLIRATDTLGVAVLKALGVSARMLGPSFTMLGVGFVVGALAVGQWGRERPPILIMGLAVLGIGSLMAMMGVAVADGMSGGAVAIYAGFVSRFLLGVGFAALGVTYGTILQRETPDDLMGRVSATTDTLTMTLPLAAPALVGLLTVWLGLGWAFAIAGGGLMAVGAVVVLARRVPVGATESLKG